MELIKKYFPSTDLEYYNRDKPAIIYNSLQTFYMLYLYLTGKSACTGQDTILYMITSYELYDIYKECMDRHNISKKRFIINIMHHIMTALGGGLILINPENSIAIEHFQWAFLHQPTSTFFLKLSMLFPKTIIWKIIFAIYFPWIRIVCGIPGFVFMMKYFLGTQIVTNLRLPNIIAGVSVFFYVLNLYWGVLIMLKAKRLFLK